MIFIFSVPFLGKSQSSIELLREYQSPTNKLYWPNKLPFQGYWQQDISYKIDAELVDSNNAIYGQEEVTYQNNSKDTLTHLFMHLYQNSFTKGSYNYMLHKKLGEKITFEAKTDSRLKNQELFYDIKLIKNNVELSHIDFNLFNTVAKINLGNYSTPEYLLPGETITIKMKFVTFFDMGSIRRRMKMFKHDGVKHFDGVHFYPRMCVYDRKMGWETDQHYDREFYGDFGAFDVALKVPKKYYLEATGILQNEDSIISVPEKEALKITNYTTKKKADSIPEILKDSNGTRTWKFKANNVHDFSFTADPHYRYGVKEWNGIKIVALVQQKNAPSWQKTPDFTQKVIENYSKVFGMYEWPKIVVADAQDGMEYNMITLCGGGDPGNHFVIAHEVGHEWFYGMLGNNETYRALMDEGFTQYLTAEAIHAIDETKRKYDSISYSKKYIPGIFDNSVINPYVRSEINQELLPLNTHSDDYSATGKGQVYGMVYYKTASMLHSLRYILGEQIFFDAMRYYVRTWKMAHPYPEDFRKCIIDFTKQDLNPFFDQWVETNKYIDYGISSIKQKGFKADITLNRRGTMSMPINITFFGDSQNLTYLLIPNSINFYSTGFKDKLNFAHGTEILPTPWLGFGNVERKFRFSIPIGFKIKEAVIDPQGMMADIDLVNNQWKKHFIYRFDHLKQGLPNRRYFEIFHRPEIWYNRIDGLKLGYHLDGDYFDIQDQFTTTLWINTGLLSRPKDISKNKAREIISGFGDYYFPLHRWNKSLTLYLSGGNVDGLSKYKVSLKKQINKSWTLTTDIIGLNRRSTYQSDYLFFPTEWQTGKWNNQLNFTFRHFKNYPKWTSDLILHSINSSFFSDYSFSGIQATLIHQYQIKKVSLKMRYYFGYMQGRSIPKESKIFLGGANPQDMMEDKYARSIGIVPVEALSLSQNLSFFQTGGGMNLRAYTGYLNPISVGGVQYLAYSGNRAAAINAELNLTRLFPLKVGGLNKYLNIQSYLFGEAGNMSIQTIEGKLITGNKILSDVGIGLLWKFQLPKLNRLKSFELRTDFPVFISDVPFASSQKNLDFRWIIGVGRCF